MMNNAIAGEITPPNPLNTLSLSIRVLENTLSNTHYRVIGTCVWARGLKPEPGLAIEQFLPDLIATVSNQPGHNPWTEANLLYENETAVSAYEAAFRTAINLPFDHADTSSGAAQFTNSERLRIVSIIGSPTNFYHLPKLSHKPETTFGKLYYSSLLDAISNRTEAGEIAYMATHPNLLMTGFIGSALNHWGYEIPRLMQVTSHSRFRASVVAAMHAADIVTNQ